MPKVKRDNKNGKWFFVADIGKKPDGSRNQIKRSFDRKKDAERKLNELLNQYYKGEYIEPSKMKYEELIESWLKTRKNILKPQTFNTQYDYIKNHVLPNFKNMYLSKIKKMHIQNFINELSENNLAPGTVKKIHSILKLSLDYAVSNELILKNPAKGIKLPRQERKREIKVWDETQAKWFLEVAKDTQYEIAYHLALSTGMRVGEILGLRWKDIDFKKKTIFVTQTLTTDGKHFDSPKTKNSRRIIMINDKLIEGLKKQKARIKKIKKELKSDYKDYDLVVPSLLGTPVNQSNLRRNFNNLLEKAGLTQIRIHDLRHSHATLLLAKNVNVKVISERLGHADTRMTLDTYSHLLPSMQDTAVKSLNEIFD